MSNRKHYVVEINIKEVTATQPEIHGRVGSRTEPTRVDSVREVEDLARVVVRKDSLDVALKVAHNMLDSVMGESS